MSHFIAEVSSNHYRDLERCFDFIDCAANVGCHSVKFQLFKVGSLFSSEILSKSEAHRKRKDWELPSEFIPHLAERCKQKGVQFSCTPFYLDAVDELRPFVDFYKIASYELLWDALLAKCAATGIPVILSTGMAELSEIEHAVEVLRANGCEKPILLHCTSAYPTPYEEANLAAIKTMREVIECQVGWSDHTREPGVIHRAIHQWGAEFIEFHLDLDGKGEEYASGHCWLPQEISAVIRDTSRAFSADGNGIKKPGSAEFADREWRADPSDGLRPLKAVRQQWMP